MLMKNCNAFDFTHKQIFKSLMRDNLGGRPCAFARFAHISKATTGFVFFTNENECCSVSLVLCYTLKYRV